MKSIITVLSIFIIANTSLTASGNPVAAKLLFAKSDMAMSVMRVDQKSMFKHADYNAKLDALEFVTKDKIAYIQIVKGNKLQYQLPVMSNKLKIGRAMFGKGIYKIGFITTEGKKIEFTQLEVHK